jgi:hypothetical protein
VTTEQAQPVYIVKLRPERDVINPVHNLRRLLKRALRDFHLRCIDCTEVRQEEDA